MNTTDELLVVTAHLNRKPAISTTPEEFILLHHETRVLNAKTDFNHGANFITKNVKGVTLSHVVREGSAESPHPSSVYFDFVCDGPRCFLKGIGNNPSIITHVEIVRET